VFHEKWFVSNWLPPNFIKNFIELAYASSPWDYSNKMIKLARGQLTMRCRNSSHSIKKCVFLHASKYTGRKIEKTVSLCPFKFEIFPMLFSIRKIKNGFSISTICFVHRIICKREHGENMLLRIVVRILWIISHFPIRLPILNSSWLVLQPKILAHNFHYKPNELVLALAMLCN